MVNKLKEQMSNAKILVLNIIIMILAVVTVVVLGMTVREIFDSFTMYYQRENSFIYAMESEDYGRLVSMYHQNCENGYGEEKSLQEYYGVAKYYEAAFSYKMYVQAEDTEHAEIHRIAMGEAVAQMGDLAFLTEQINEKLGITE